MPSPSGRRPATSHDQPMTCTRCKGPVVEVQATVNDREDPVTRETGTLIHVVSAAGPGGIGEGDPDQWSLGVAVEGWCVDGETELRSESLYLHQPGLISDALQAAFARIPRLTPLAMRAGPFRAVHNRLEANILKVVGRSGGGRRTRSARPGDRARGEHRHQSRSPRILHLCRRRRALRCAPADAPADPLAKRQRGRDRVDGRDRRAPEPGPLPPPGRPARIPGSADAAAAAASPRDPLRRADAPAVSVQGQS